MLPFRPCRRPCRCRCRCRCTDRPALRNATRGPRPGMRRVRHHPRAILPGRRGELPEPRRENPRLARTADAIAATTRTRGRGRTPWRRRSSPPAALRTTSRIEPSAAMPTLVIKIPTPPGTYTVHLFFMEIFHTAANKRKFTHDVNGKKAGRRRRQPRRLCRHQGQEQAAAALDVQRGRHRQEPVRHRHRRPRQGLRQPHDLRHQRQGCGRHQGRRQVRLDVRAAPSRQLPPRSRPPRPPSRR